MSATGIVALFSFLSACSQGANGSLDGLLAMLSACRQVIFHLAKAPDWNILGSASSLESVLAPSIPVALCPPPNNPKRKPSRKMHNIGGLRLQQVGAILLPTLSPDQSASRRDDRFRIRHCRVCSLSPVLDVSTRLCHAPENTLTMDFHAASGRTISAPFGGGLLDWASSPHLPSSSGG
jgi:hypothetical protein